MNRVTLTSAMIARLQAKPPPKGAAPFLNDAKVPGLLARIHPTGAVTYCLRYKGRRHAITKPIGSQVDGLEHARGAALTMLADLSQGRETLGRLDTSGVDSIIQLSSKEVEEHTLEHVVAEFTRRQ